MKLTPDLINKGTQRANFQGMYKNKFNDIESNPNINETKEPKQKKTRLDRNIVETGIYRAESVYMRGFKTDKNYEGKKPNFWNTSDFTPLKVGDFSFDSGVSRGGEFTTKAPTKYKPEFGVAGQKEKNKIDKPTGNPSAFPIIKKNIKF